MTRTHKLVFRFLLALNVIELVCGIGQVVLGKFPAAEMKESEIEIAYFLIVHSAVMLAGLLIVGRCVRALISKSCPDIKDDRGGQVAPLTSTPQI
jgi:hypothetical protein